VVDDLHDEAGVHAGEIGEELEPQLGLVVECAEHLRHVAGCDPDLGLVVPLADRPDEAIAEPPFELAPKRAIHPQTPSGMVGPTGRWSHWPRRSLMSCCSFIIPKIRPSGRGGQPGTYTSTGMIRSIPSTVL
jgi:hypothetical protein